MAGETDGTATTLEQAYRSGVNRLFSAGKENAERDTGILLELVTGHGALSRLVSPDSPLTSRQAQLFDKALERRALGEPVHRITGTREFYGIPLSLNSATLIPRPDTEILVDLVIPFAREKCAQTGQCRILDLGTGSGAIALALLNEIPKATAVGTDISDQALRAARGNAESLGLADRFTTLRSDWFSNVNGTYDIIVSNPPYIARGEIAALDDEVRLHDPMLALDGGMDGMDAYGIIAARALPFLASGGLIAVEIGHTQHKQVITFFEASGFKHLRSTVDLAGLDRVVSFTR